MKKLLLPLAAAFLLAACATPQTNYFTLPDSTFQMPEHTRGKTETALRVVPAEPLNRGGLAYRSDTFRLDYARNHLWAQPLDQAAAARFANEFNRMDTGRYFVPAHQSKAAQSATIYLEAFQGSYLGSTLVEGYIRSDSGSRRFRAETPQHGDGYEAMLESLSQGVSAAAAQIYGR